MYYSTTYLSPIGLLTLARVQDKLAGLWIAGQKYHGQPLSGKMTEDHQVFGQAKDWLDRYFAGQRPAIGELPLAPPGSEFRQAVWSILCEIPYGQVISYGAIAKKMAAKMKRSSMSSQAVGGAVGHNPVSIIIPCHRVVGAKGGLTGYAAGIDIKAKLLEFEGAAVPGLFASGPGASLMLRPGGQD